MKPYPRRPQDALSVAGTFVRERIFLLVLRYFYTRTVVGLENSILMGVWGLPNVRRTWATLYHPEGNRHSERANRMAKVVLHAIINHGRADEWDKRLSPAFLLYQAVQHFTAGLLLWYETRRGNPTVGWNPSGGSARGSNWNGLTS